MIETIKYIDLSLAQDSCDAETEVEFKVWIDDHPHNNGYADWFEVFDPEFNNEYAYHLINKFFLENGAVIGEKILIHSNW